MKDEEEAPLYDFLQRTEERDLGLRLAILTGFTASGSNN